jgi:hypothetical protein
MTTKKTVAEIKRNAAIIADLENAEVLLRVAYKTADGWKRLRLPANASTALRQASIRLVEARLNKLVPPVVEAVVDKAISELVDNLNN